MYIVTGRPSKSSRVITDPRGGAEQHHVRASNRHRIILIEYHDG